MAAFGGGFNRIFVANSYRYLTDFWTENDFPRISKAPT